MRLRRAGLNICLILATLGGMIYLLPFGGLKGLTTNVAVLEDRASDPRLRPVDVAGSPSDAAAFLSGWTESHSRWKMELLDDSNDAIHVHLTRSTLVFRFVDDVHLTLTPTATGTRITGKSQSRVGKGDLGQNARNLIELRRILEHAEQL